MSADWYVSQHGRQLGPFSSGQLQEMASAGKLKPDDLVTQAGGSKWTPAKQVKGLTFIAALAVQSMPAPLPSQLPLLPTNPGPAVIVTSGSRSHPSNRTVAVIVGAVVAGMVLLGCLGVSTLFVLGSRGPERDRLLFEQKRAEATKEIQARAERDEQEYEARIEKEIKSLGGSYISASAIRNHAFWDNDPDAVVGELKQMDAKRHREMADCDKALEAGNIQLAKLLHQAALITLDSQLSKLLQLVQHKRLSEKDRFGYRGTYMAYLATQQAHIEGGKKLN